MNSCVARVGNIYTVECGKIELPQFASHSLRCHAIRVRLGKGVVRILPLAPFHSYLWLRAKLESRVAIVGKSGKKKNDMMVGVCFTTSNPSTLAP